MKTSSIFHRLPLYLKNTENMQKEKEDLHIDILQFDDYLFDLDIDQKRNLPQEIFMVRILCAINEKKDTRKYYHQLMRYIDDISVENWIILLRKDFENACVH